jgi:septal ring factor EnvC (AmiA/AmiB activator)
MGLFDRKKGDDKLQVPNEDDFHDSPVETVSLSNSNANVPRPAAARPAPAAPADDEVRMQYGIEQAIQLMRALPVADSNVELVVGVIKTTLESLKVRTADIIADAARKQKDLEGRVERLQKEIVDFEKEIADRRGTIAKLEADHAETTMVKQRLELAEKAQQAAKTPAPPPPQVKVGGK